MGFTTVKERAMTPLKTSCQASNLVQTETGGSKMISGVVACLILTEESEHVGMLRGRVRVEHSDLLFGRETRMKATTGLALRRAIAK